MIDQQNPVKILHIIPGYGGGISTLVKNLLLGSNPTQMKMDIAGFTAFPPEYQHEVSASGGKTFRLVNVRINTLVASIMQLRRLIKNNRYDVIHLHLNPKQDFYFCLLAFIFGVRKRIVHAHIAGERGELRRGYALRHKLDQLLTTVLSTDLASCSKMASKFRFGESRIEHRPVFHLPNSISPQVYSKELSVQELSSLRKDLDIEDDKLVIGNVGYLGYQKNQPFMFKIAKKMKSENINFIWLFIGTGAYRERFEKLIKDMDIQDCVKLVGRRDDISKMYKLMDVSVLASHFEGLPTVAIESQAAGTPVIISDTISPECDLGLGMVNVVSLDAPINDWSQSIQSIAGQNVPSWKQRLSSIERLGFTASGAAELYYQFLTGKLKSHEIGEGVL